MALAESQLFNSSEPAQLLHLFHHLEGSRAILDVLLVHMYIINHLPFIQVRKSCTIRGTDLVDTAFIVLKVQKLAGLLFIVPVLVLLVKNQPFRFKLFRRH